MHAKFKSHGAAVRLMSAMAVSLACVVSPAAAAAGAAAALKPGTYCQRTEVTAGDNGPSLGAMYAEARVQQKPGQWWFRFHTAMPDTQRILGTGTVLMHPKADGRFVFYFTDGEGNRGRGFVKAKGRQIAVELEEFGERDPDNMNQLGRSYGAYVLSPGRCPDDWG